MADTHLPEPAHLNGAAASASGGGGGGGPVTVTSSETVGAKRQRRPSVRLGEIGGGDQLYDAHPRRAGNTKPWKQPIDGKKEVNSSNKASKTRALTNLTTASAEFAETLDEDKEVNLDAVAIGSWRVKDSKKRAPNSTAGTKRVRSNWGSKSDDGGGGGDNNNIDGEEKFSGGEYIEGNYRESDIENSESLLRENSPIHSLENLGDGNERNETQMYYNRRAIRIRDNHNHDHHDEGIELSGPSDAEGGRDFRNFGGGSGGEDAVRIWLNSLGLGRYAPVFEIHEVDDEVLPMLTLEDLKDMGINAVGSRRKMFCAIQKLGKGFS